MDIQYYRGHATIMCGWDRVKLLLSCNIVGVRNGKAPNERTCFPAFHMRIWVKLVTPLYSVVILEHPSIKDPPNSMPAPFLRPSFLAQNGLHDRFRQRNIQPCVLFILRFQYPIIKDLSNSIQSPSFVPDFLRGTNSTIHPPPKSTTHALKLVSMTMFPGWTSPHTRSWACNCSTVSVTCCFHFAWCSEANVPFR